MVVSHQDQVVGLPPETVVNAGSTFCPNAMLRIGERVLTLQGHPEMNVPIVERLIDMRRDQLGADDHAACLDSLSSPLSHAEMGRWLADFIRQGVDGVRASAGGATMRPAAAG